MRDPNEWAKEMAPHFESAGLSGPRCDIDALASLIREAQEDGAREWSERAEVAECERDLHVQKWLDRCCELEAQVAALTERAERVETALRAIANMKDDYVAFGMFALPRILGIANAALDEKP